MGIGIVKAIFIRIFTWILRTQNYEPATMLLNQCIIKYIALNILVHYDIGNRQNWNGFFLCLHGLTGSQNAVLSEYWLSWRRQQIETFSALLALCEGNSLVTGKFPPQRPVTRRFDVSLICAWINGWVNFREGGDLGLCRARYYVILMLASIGQICNKKQYRNHPSTQDRTDFKTSSGRNVCYKSIH